MKQNIIFILSLFILCLYSCEEKEIELFSDGNEIFFDKFYMDAVFPGNQEADSTENSFFFYPTDATTLKTRVVVCLSGRLLEKDTEFGLKVIKEGTTATPEEYTIKDSYVFHANNIKEDATYVTDTIEIEFHKTAHLESREEGVRLVVELVGNKNLQLGQFERRRAIIICTTRTAKPDWWDDEIEDELLGKYSQKKYKLFLDNVEGAETLDALLIKEHPDKAIQLAYKFKKWLNEQDPKVIDEDGNEMTLSI